MADMGVVILIEENKRMELDQLAKSLEKKGLHIRGKLPRFRTIVGTADSSAVEGLKSVEGVEMVRPQYEFQLPPLDEKVPQ